MLGALDFAQSHRYDVRYRIKERYVLEEILRQAAFEDRKLALQYYLAGMSGGIADIYNKSLKHVEEAKSAAQHLIRPWLVSATQAKYNSLVRDWENTYNMSVDSEEFRNFTRDQERLIALMQSEDR